MLPTASRDVVTYGRVFLVGTEQDAVGPGARGQDEDPLPTLVTVVSRNALSSSARTE